MTAPIRVLLVDDQALFREGLRTLLGTQPGLVVVGEALLASGVAPGILTVLGSIWPIVLIIVGLWLIIRWRGARRE